MEQTLRRIHLDGSNTILRQLREVITGAMRVTSAR